MSHENEKLYLNYNSIHLAPLKTEFTKCFDRQDKRQYCTKQRRTTQKALTKLTLVEDNETQ